jgi:hypothetical protein
MGLGGTIHYYFLHYLLFENGTWPPSAHYYWILSSVVAVIIASFSVRAAGNSMIGPSERRLPVETTKFLKTT